MASRNVFDLSAYSSLESANLLHQSELKILELASRYEPQPFELFMEQLAQSGRLHRHYTQNIDCRTSKFPALSQRTINVHGRLDRLRCHIYSQHTVPVQQQSLPELLGARCPICDEKNEERSLEGKRLHSVGFLRPDALLYNDFDGADPQIMNAVNEDLRQNVDAVIIVGTTLHIPLLQQITAKLCRAMKWPRGEPIGEILPVSNKGMVVWISEDKPKMRAKLRSLIDFEFLQDCDEFAVQISQWLGNLKGKVDTTKNIINAKHPQRSHLVSRLRQRPMLRMKGNPFPNKAAPNLIILGSD
jgi:NAD-dependent SIR2 family protein deacetylase